MVIDLWCGALLTELRIEYRCLDRPPESREIFRRMPFPKKKIYAMHARGRRIIKRGIIVIGGRGMLVLETNGFVVKHLSQKLPLNLRNNTLPPLWVPQTLRQSKFLFLLCCCLQT